MKMAYTIPMPPRLLTTCLLLMVLAPTAWAASASLSIPDKPIAPLEMLARPDGSVVMPPSSATGNAIIQSEVLPPPDADGTGVLTPQQGGLGLDVWEGTPKELAENLVSRLPLTSSPTLNRLSKRLLLSLSKAPQASDQATDDASAVTALLAKRVEKLLAFGEVKAAALLLKQQGTRTVPESLQLKLAEHSILDPAHPEACKDIQAAMPQKPNGDWQSLLIVCQLREEQKDAALLSLATLKEGNPNVDGFVALAEKVLDPQKKYTPRQITPLKPALLALLQVAKLPLPSDAFLRADDELIAPLLLSDSKDALAKLTLAERAAGRGLTDAGMLRAIYQGIPLPAEAVASAAGSTQADPKMRAALVQAMAGGKQDNGQLLMTFLSSVKPSQLTGAMGDLLADFIEDVQPTEPYAALAAPFAKALLLAGKNDAAKPWIELLRAHVSKVENGAQQQSALWPLLAVSGILKSEDVTSQLGPWIESQMGAESAANSKNDPRRYALAVASLLQALQIGLPAGSWQALLPLADTKVMRGPALNPLLAARYGSSTLSIGETVALTAMVADKAALNDIPLPLLVMMVRHLASVGLQQDAHRLAVEVLAGLLP